MSTYIEMTIRFDDPKQAKAFAQAHADEHGVDVSDILDENNPTIFELIFHAHGDAIVAEESATKLGGTVLKKDVDDDY